MNQKICFEQISKLNEEISSLVTLRSHIKETGVLPAISPDRYSLLLRAGLMDLDRHLSATATEGLDLLIAIRREEVAKLKDLIKP